MQLAALEKANEKPDFAFFMEMGLGKTAVVLAEFINLYMKDKVQGLMVVCDYSLTSNWIDELSKWGLENKFNYAIWPNYPKKGDTRPWMWVLYHEAFSVGGAKAVGLTQGILLKYDTYLVIDESIAIKNHKSVRNDAYLGRAKQTRGMRNLAKYRRLLSGWPQTQGPHDLWAQMMFIHATNRNFYAWRNRYCVMGGFKNKKVVGTKNEDELTELVGTVSFRALKADWTDLPPKIYANPRMVRLTPKQQKFYHDMLNEMVVELPDDREVAVRMAVTRMLKLQQISSGFIFDEEGGVFEIDGVNNKIKALLEFMDQINGKVIIPCVFTPSLDIVQDALKKYNPVILRGGMTPDEISEAKHKFNNYDEFVPIVCQMQTGRYGHTLLGTDNRRCATTFFYENSFDLNDRIQIEDRNHRHGQDTPVTYVDCISSDAEIAVIKALQYKKNLAENVINAFKHLQG